MVTANKTERGEFTAYARELVNATAHITVGLIMNEFISLESSLPLSRGRSCRHG